MTRTHADIAKLFAYSRWATDLILASVAELAPTEFVQPVGGSFGSVQATFVHVYGADWVWLERWQGGSPRALPPDDDARARRDPRRGGRSTKAHAFRRPLAPERMAQPLDLRQLRGRDLTSTRSARRCCTWPTTARTTAARS